MPRSSGGIYTLPESPFISGTVIRSSPVNNDFSDIATALTQSLATTGVSDMTGPLRAASGSVTAPSITFAASLGTGFYRIADNKVGYAVNGVNKATFNDDGTFDYTAIKFGNSAVAGNYLDWYEENTFIPVLRFGGASVGILYAVQTGKFTRIGNVVNFTLTITLTDNGTSVGAATISGLPYAVAANTSFSMLPIVGIAGLDEFDTNIGASAVSAASVIDLSAYSIDGELGFTLGEPNFNDDASFVISGTYLV